MNSNKKSYDPTFIKDWCLFILNFLHSRGKTQGLYENLIRETLKYYGDNNKKELYLMFRTVYSIAFTSPENEKELLNEKLIKDFGKKLEDFKPEPTKHRALKGEKLEQLKFMGDWSIAIMEYIKKSVPNGPISFFSDSIYIINKTVESNDFHGMKAVYNDTNDMARGLTKIQLIELNKILQEKFGRSLIDEEKEIMKKVDQVIKRDRIINDEEFYLLTSYIDELIIAKDNDRINKLNKILFDYENGKSKTKI